MQVKYPSFAIIPIFDPVLFKAICGMRDTHLHNSLQQDGCHRNDTFSMVKIKRKNLNQLILSPAHKQFCQFLF